MQIESPSAEVCNADVQAELGRLLVNEKAEELGRDASAVLGPFVVNHYSFTFRVTVKGSRGVGDFMVKIPKDDLRRRSKTVFPLSPQDRLLANDEAASLRALASCWDSTSPEVRWISLCGEVPQFNAVITRYVEGEEAVARIRRLDIAGRLGSKESDLRVERIMGHFGAALGKYHRATAEHRTLRLADESAKIMLYRWQLRQAMNPRLADSVSAALARRAGMVADVRTVQSLKGIDVRNLLVESQDRLVLLDPGRMRRAPAEADLARFLMTYRILYWGTPWLMLTTRPSPLGEAAFLAAYRENAGDLSEELFWWFLLKEQLKHWRDAIRSVALRNWWKYSKRIIMSSYVNRYYDAEVTRHLASDPAN